MANCTQLQQPRCKTSQQNAAHMIRPNIQSHVVDSTPLILLDHGYNVNEVYYRDVKLLQQQLLLSIRQVSSKFIFQQHSARRTGRLINQLSYP